MNSYQLISKFRKVRDDTHLSTATQALYHELVSICNELKWKEVFFIRSNVICGNLDISDNTLRKSRVSLAESGLIYYETSRDKRIGCYYSFVQKLSNDIVSSAVSSAIIEDESSEDIAYEDESKPTVSSAASSAVSPSISSAKFEDDKKASSAVSSAIIEDDMQFTPYIDIKTINKRESHAHTCEIPPPKKPKSSRKKEGDDKPLSYPYSSLAFMSTWENLRNTPKWQKKLNLALQISLDKLGKYEEEFAIEQIERAIESNWTGVVFPDTPGKYQEWLNIKNGKSINEASNKGAYSGGRASQDKAASRKSLENLADSILEQLASEERP